MALSQDQILMMDDFLSKSNYLAEGAVITDLDGTAVHEFGGATIIHKDVEVGLKTVYETSRPVIINTLRFPLSVIRTFGKEWYKISSLPIPVILLNGSQLGYIIKQEDRFVFDSLANFPVGETEISQVLAIASQSKEIMKDIVLFYYPADWTRGEIIWTADSSRIPYLAHKYQSASEVISCSVAELGDRLHAAPICMMLLLIDIPADKLMAYQHTRRDNFYTSTGINKRTGTEEMAKLLNIDLDGSVGAGDSAMDVFLDATGLSLHVRNQHLPFRGKFSTIKLDDYHDFGSLLQYISQFHKALH